MPPLPTYSLRQIILMALIFASYLLTAQVFAYFYAFVPTSPALIWPASGIALAGLIVGGIRLWPAIFLASFTHQLLIDNGLFVATGLAFANVVQPVLGAWFLRRFGFQNTFSRVPDTLVFLIIALIITAIVPALGVLTFTLAGRALPLDVLGTFVPWWIAQMLSVLIVTPLLIRWLPRISFRRTRMELLEAALALASVVAVAILLFWTPYREVADVPLVYLILAPLLWIALRIGPRFMSFALFLNAAIALGGTAYRVAVTGNGVNLGYALLQTEIFIIMISLTFLLLVTVAEERKDTANDLRENVRRLEDAIERIRKEDEAKSRFIATLAHELRNPLAPLMSSLELLKLEKPNRERLEELADSMTGNLRTMRHLLDDLLDISRISREKLALQKQQVDLHGILAQSLRTVKPLIEERGHTVETSLPEDAIRLEADPVRLEQIFVNLINNAAKYTEPGGSIRIEAAVSGNFVVVSVRDTGIGMDTRLLEHVFEPFYQIDQPGKLHTGLGIGLSLTRSLVRLHNGTIEAASEGPGHGSTFSVRLPLPHARVSDGANAAPNPGTRAAHTGTFRILVVDDNRAAADALAKLLALRGHETHAVYTGAAALCEAPRMKPDIVLLDIGLPDIEGYDVANALRADDTVTATLVAVTGFGQESDIRKAERAGFAYHLTKPAGLAEIEQVLDSIARP